MKYLYILSCLLLFIFPLNAQQDTVFASNTETTETLSPTVLTAARNEVFKMQDPCRFLLKFNLISVIPTLLTEIKTYNARSGINGNDEQAIHLSGEIQIKPFLFYRCRIANATSYQTGATITDNDWFSSFTARIEPRWYYGMAKKVKNGTQANNLSGNYLSVEYAYTRYRKLLPEARSTILLNWGAQRRLFNRGYFDLGFGAGMAFTKSSPFSRGGRAFFARPRAAIGLAAALTRSRTKVLALIAMCCDVFCGRAQDVESLTCLIWSIFIRTTDGALLH